MNPLARALRKSQSNGKVPVPWSSLRSFAPLRGNLIVVLGAPGQGKSALALNWCLNVPLPTLMLSLDTDLMTQGTRAASILSGRPVQKVKTHPEKWSRIIEKRGQNLRTYDISLNNVKELLDLVKAEKEFWGEAPVLTVVDNVSNLLTEGGYDEYRKIFIDLHRVARMGETCVVALHHVKRPTNGDPRLTLYSGQYTGEQEAEMVIGLWSHSPGSPILQFSVLKNRSGEAASDGTLSYLLGFDRTTMGIRDLTQEELTMYALAGVK